MSSRSTALLSRGTSLFRASGPLLCAALIAVSCSAETDMDGLIGDYRLDGSAPLANEVKGALPDIAFNGFSATAPPLLTGQEIPMGGSGAAGNGWALTWTKMVPQVGYKSWQSADVRVPPDAGLDLGARFSLWMRIVYGGKVRGGGGYTLLTLDGLDGEPVLNWRTTDTEEMELILRLTGPDGTTVEKSCRTSGRRLLPRYSRWYDLAVTFDAGMIVFYATELGRNGPGVTEAQEIHLGDGLTLAKAAGPLWVLKNTNTVLERLRIGRDRVPRAPDIAALSAGVRVPGPEKTERVIVGADRQLFLDDAVIERLDGVARRFHAAEKYPGNPVIRKTQPTEVEGYGPMFFGTILYDRQEHLFRVWHQALTFIQPQVFNHLYAWSRDGVNWTKPKLDILGPDNRYNPPGYEGGHAGNWLSLRKDTEDTDPKTRYKGFIQRDPYWYITSADGLHWEEVGIAAVHTDDTDSAAYHAGRKEYVKVGRPCPDGRNLALRLIMTCVSKTPLADGNSPWHLVMFPDQTDVARDPDLQYYHMPAFGYENVYLALLGIYHAGPLDGRSEHELAFSRDGLNWHRISQGTYFIPTGQPGSWDAGFATAPGSGPVEVGDELWFYYSSYSGPHHGPYGQGGIGLARLRRDGFVSLAAGAQAGTVTSKPFELVGDSLEINAKAGGSVRVRLLDEGGGLLAEGVPFTGDDCHHVVIWRDHPDLAVFKGRAVRLEFVLRDAEIYAFQAADRRDLDAAGDTRQAGYRPEKDPWATYVPPEEVPRTVNPKARKGPLQLPGDPVFALLLDACTAGAVEPADVCDVTRPASSSPKIVGSPPWTETGAAGSGQGIVFDGSSYIDFGQGPDGELALGGEQLTIEARVSIEAGGGGAIVSRDNWPADRGWYLDITTDGKVRFAVAKARQQGGIGPQSAPGAITPETFHDIVAVFDRGAIRISVDGEQVAYTDKSGTLTAMHPGSDATPFLIGAARRHDRPSELFSGTLESIAVYAGVPADSD